MTISSEITRIKTNIASAYTALEEKGAIMPELMNSNNLAETVGSVKTGGGTRNYIFDIIDSIINSYTEDDARFQRIITGSQITETLIGYSFYSADTIYVYKYNSFKIAIPESATIEDSTDDDYKKIIFTDNERWLISCCDLNNYPIIKVNVSVLDTSSNKSIINYANIKNCTGNVIQKKLSGVLDGCKNLEDLKVTGINFNDATTSVFSSLRFLKDTSVFFNNSINSHVGDTITSRNLSILGDSTMYNMGILTRWEKFPFVVDFSGYTATDEINFNKVGMSYNKCVDLKLILPSSANINIKFADNTYAYLVLTKESLQYMAEHAPTVENKTLTIGDANIAICGGTGSEIITTLTNKGWTVN